MSSDAKGFKSAPVFEEIKKALEKVDWIDYEILLLYFGDIEYFDFC